MDQAIIETVAKSVYSEISHGSIIVCYYRIEMGKEPHGGEPDDIKTPDFKEWLYEYCSDKIHELYYELQSRRENNELPVFRVITAPKDWTPKGHAGDYWSWDKDAAAAHWGNYDSDHVEWMMETLLTYAEVDWVSTFVANILHEDEREITIRKGVVIEPKDYYRV